ncbi:MAG TPA: lipopolysaccharide biosynthesis protein [Pyrinomonadaceae bacterium]|nr:lipopolysaccharide biosynthesis protein [Pyrinomonadaceae bacterium]
MSKDLPGSNSRQEYFDTEHLTAAIGSRTARGGVVTIISHGLKFVLSIGATAVLARLLTPHDYGLIGMVAVFTGFVAMFKDLGLSLATVQRPEITDEQISTLFWVNVTISVAITALMILLAPLIGWFYGEPRLTLITMVTATGFVFGGFAVQHEALLKRQMRFYALSLIAFASMMIGYIVGIILAWRGASYWSLVFSQLALLSSNTLGVWFTCRWRPGRPKRNTGVRSMLSFGGNITGYALINYVSKNTDSLIVGRIFGPQLLGLYTKAVQLLSLPTDQINEPLSTVSIPALSRLADSPERYRQAYLRIMEKVIMVTMPAVILMLATADWVVLIILGPQWSDSAQILVFMGIAGLFQPVAATGGWLLVSQGRVRDMLRWSLINAPISILSIVAGVRWGVLGVAASFSLGRILVANPLLFWFVGRSGPVRMSDFYRLLAPFTGASLCALLACVAFRRFVPIANPIVGFVACGMIVAVSTPGFLALMPAGRKALADIKHSMLLLLPHKPKIV